jgi:predicted porin
MKKTLIAIASVAALGAAQADVTLYGVIDAGFGTSSQGLGSDANNPSNANIYAISTQGASGASSTAGYANPGRTTSMTNGLLTPSRWGLKGSEDLGGGLKGMFTLESALNIAAGTNPNDHALLAAQNQGGTTGAGDSSLNGQMFDREASVGLSGDFGQITAGFQLNLLGELHGINDPLGAGYISPFGTYGGLTGGNSSFTGRASNSFKYKTTIGNTQIGAFYAFGGEAGNMGAGSQMGFSAIVQATPALQVDFGVNKMNDNVAYTGNTTSNPNTAGTQVAATNGVYPTVLAATYYNSIQSLIGVNFQVNPTLKLNAGYETYTMSNPSNPAADAGLNQVLGVQILQTSPGTVTNGTSTTGAINTQPYATNQTTTFTWFGGTYTLSPVSRISAAYYQQVKGAYTKNNAEGAATGTATAAQTAYTQSGTQIFGLVYDYDLSKKSDVYLAGNYQHFDGGSQWGAANLNNANISFFGAGYRMKF